MAQDNQITVRFKAAGHKELKAAIDQLHLAQVRLEKGAKAYERAAKKINKETLLGVKNNRLLGNSFATIRSKMLLASFAASIVTMTLGKLFKAAGEQQQAEIKLANAIGFTSQKLLDHASAMQQVTQFGDEVVLNAQAMIASFIKDEQVIISLTEATADLAAAKGLDLASAADLVAKSVGSSTNSLSRYGIAADGAAKSTERAESVARNISVLYGGQAKAQAESYAGTVVGMTNALGDAAEAFGDLIAPAVIVFSNTIKNMSNIIESAIDGIHGIAVAVDNFFFGMVSLKDVTKPVQQELGLFQKQLADMTGAELQEQSDMLTNMIMNYEDTQVAVAGTTGEFDNLRKMNYAVTDATSTLNNGVGEFVATSQPMVNAIATIATEEQKLALIEQDKARRQAFAQELFAKTASSQKNATKDMIEWVKANKESFDTEESHIAVLAMLEAQYNKTGESALKGAIKVVSSANSALSAIEANGNAIANANKKEELSNAKTQKAKDAIEKKYAQQAEDRAKKLQKWKVASAISNVALGITQTWRDPALPVWAKVIATVAQAAAGTAQIATIQGQKFEQGGMVGGRRHSQGGTLIEAEQGEFIMSRNAVNAVGVEAMNRINAGGGAGAVNISFAGNVMSQDFIEDEAIPMIKEAIRRGADIGVA